MSDARAAAKDLSPREAALLTGLSRTLMYREIERGHLRAYKVGGRLRITPEALADWKRLHAVAACEGDTRMSRHQPSATRRSIRRSPRIYGRCVTGEPREHQADSGRSLAGPVVRQRTRIGPAATNIRP